MRLRVSSASANEELITLLNRGYQVLNEIHQDYAQRRQANQFDDAKTGELYGPRIDEWATQVVTALENIFPTELEVNTFLNPDVPFGTVSGDYNYQSLRKRFTWYIKGLDLIRQNSVPQYTDLPVGLRLFVEDIESFRKVRDVNHAA